MAGISTIDATLEYKKSTETEYTEVENIQEFPDFGGETESIEVTTLKDKVRKYIAGLKSYGESLDFVVLHTKTEFLKYTNELAGETLDWKFTLSDGLTCTWSGTCSTKMNGGGTGASVQYTLSVKPESDMVWA